MRYKACQKCADSVGNVNIFGNILMIILKGYLGVIGGSKGLIADAIHSCADLLATIVMIIGLKISGQEQDERYPYGYGKFEYIVAILIYIFLVFIAIYILYDGVLAIIENRQVIPHMVAVWGAIFSILINELMFRQSLCAGTQISSPSMVAKAWESRTDVYSSIAVVIGIVGAKLGFHFMDPLAAVIVGVLILKICVEMMKESILNLLDRVPAEFELDEFSLKLAEQLKHTVVTLENVSVRELGSRFEFDIEANVPDCITVHEGERIKELIRKTAASLVERQTIVRVHLFPFEKVAA